VPTRIDLQRYKKTYPFLRQEPRILYTSETEGSLANAVIESVEANFSGNDTLTYNFTKTFTAIPNVVATPKGASANFTVFVSDVTLTYVTIKASSSNSDKVHIHAVQVTS